MKFLLSFVCVLCCFGTVAQVGQQITYENWKQEATEDIRLLPEYGNVEKSKGQKDADEEFKGLAIKQDGTSEKASAHMVDAGFSYLYKGDLKTAMYRFNQAWLLNPKNEDAYWGFGAVYFMFSDHEKAMEQYSKGLSLNPRSSRLLTDKATVFMTRSNYGKNKINLDSAIIVFRKSYSIDSKNQNTLFKLSACYLFRDDCPNALKYYTECKSLGGRPLTKAYISAIEKRCKE